MHSIRATINEQPKTLPDVPEPH